jgi:phenylalanine-4-hydroxylase
LLSTKFNIPFPVAKIVRRPRLLDQSLEQKNTLTLVCGPVGYGKTPIVSEWFQEMQKTGLNQLYRLSREGLWRLPMFSKWKRIAQEREKSNLTRHANCRVR